MKFKCFSYEKNKVSIVRILKLIILENYQKFVKYVGIHYIIYMYVFKTEFD